MKYLITLMCLVILLSTGAANQSNTPKDAEILKWKDGKKAVFLLQFDDSCASQVKNAIPELIKRDMVGTFYINAGNGPFKSQKKAWTQDIPKTNMVYGNHTFTHKGATSYEMIDEELKKANDFIYSCYPEKKKPFLIAFGRPGGVPWKITKEQQAELLKKHNLVNRPGFWGFPIHIKNKAGMLALVDKALEKGDMGHHDFHGVGGDWLTTPMDIYIALLDKLQENRDKIWITDPVSYHKYLTERKEASLKTGKKSNRQISLELTCKTDAELYDLPLTLQVKAPNGWKNVSIEQEKTKTKAEVKDGVIQFDAEPVTGSITIKSSK